METHTHQHKRTSSPLAWILIIVGIFLILKHSGLGFNLLGLSPIFSGIGSFIGSVFHSITHLGLPALLIIAGVILLIGRRFIGGLLLFLVLIFIVPQFIIIPGILFIVFFPLVLIIVGIVILSKLF